MLVAGPKPDREYHLDYVQSNLWLRWKNGTPRTRELLPGDHSKSIRDGINIVNFPPKQIVKPAHLAYLIRDGIPIMLFDEARKLD